MLCGTLLGNMQLSICYDVLKKRPHEEDQKKESKRLAQEEENPQ